ncbi:MAG: cytochrome b N-terminal domain-containing protein [Caldilineales bacterium]|nr:cytochrome b N-terminal domain-containing protein [Caldilineales bacterium]
MSKRSWSARIAGTRVWRSIFRHGWPDNPLDRSLVMTSGLFLHLHPVKVNRKSLRWSYSMGLGIITVALFLILIMTGTLLMFYYVPSVERAYPTMKAIQTGIPLGQFTRDMHRWAAQLMVLAAILHAARVFYTGAYKPPREFNWVIGVVLLVLTLGASFTGYLLPWDQLAYWAVTVGTNIAGYAPGVGAVVRTLLLGGREVGQNALIRFYTLHIMVFPLLLILVISYHTWRVRKDGGLAAQDADMDGAGEEVQTVSEAEPAPASQSGRDWEIFPNNPSKTYGLVELMHGASPMVGRGPENTVFAFPVVLLVEFVLFLGTSLLLFVLSLLRHAPLEEIANPAVTADPSKAPWYFVGLQELLEHMHPVLAGIFIPAVLIVFMLVIPYWDNQRAGAGRWFTSARGRRIVGWTSLYTLIVIPLYILLDNLFVPREALRGVAPESVSQWLIPIIVIGLLVALPVLVLRRWKPTPREVLLVLFTVMFVSAIIFTVSGQLFRGPGFQLYWPWNMPDGYNPLGTL